MDSFFLKVCVLTSFEKKNTEICTSKDMITSGKVIEDKDLTLLYLCHDRYFYKDGSLFLRERNANLEEINRCLSNL